jgi:hypothetical protein
MTSVSRHGQTIEIIHEFSARLADADLSANVVHNCKVESSTLSVAFDGETAQSNEPE